MNLVAKEAAAAIPLPVANLSAQDDAIAQYFKTASDTGFNVVRVFGHGNSTSFELQTGPGNCTPEGSFAWPHVSHDSRQCLLPCAGQYDESVFRGFDYILALASLHNIKVSAALMSSVVAKSSPYLFSLPCQIEPFESQ